MTEQSTSPYTGRPIAEWLDEDVELHDADGDKIGNVVEINPDFIVAESDGGFLGLGERRVYFVPRSYVDRQEGDDWYMSIDKDQVEQMDWRQAPSDSAWASEWTQGEASLDAMERREGTRIRRYEEDLDVQKVSRQAGEVVVNKTVVEETKSIDVPVRREEVHVERRAVSDDATATDEAFSGETIRVPVMEEEVEVRKVPRVVEELEITKTATDDTRRVEETVRREEFDIADTTDQGKRDSD